MPRSPVLTGLLSARDRAHQRGRRDKKSGSGRAQDEEDREYARLEQTLDDLPDDLESIERFDLDAFVDKFVSARRDAEGSAVDAGECLRKLAIHWEISLDWKPHPRAWLALDRIYAAAEARDPFNAAIPQSRAVTAVECAKWLPPHAETPALSEPALHPLSPIARSPLSRRMFTQARAAIARALHRLPDDGDLLRTAAQVEQHDPEGSVAATVACYKRALNGTPCNRRTAFEYANILVQLRRWKEAFDVYEAIPAHVYTGNFTFGLEVSLLERAWCLTRSGHGGAAARFDALLTRWTRDPALVESVSGAFLFAAAATDFPELRPRVEALLTLVEAREYPAYGFTRAEYHTAIDATT